ncbi:MAG TPA: tetratricopeptide repeat protein [Caulobacteraceae bacterium]|nr:tetratricopeptide repeat protein [Caulobacteraceae bacterium]
MQLRGRSVALYGRFSGGRRDELQRRVVRARGSATRDLTRRSDILVIGAEAARLVENGHLQERLERAKARGVPVLGERSFARALEGEAPEPPTLPLSTALAGTGLARADAELLAAFDLIELRGEACRFGDAGVIRTAGELIGGGRSAADAVRILARARDLAPIGRHKIVLTASGEAALQWDDGRTTLEGQGVLPLDEDHATLDDLFEAAEIAEADGELDEAARLYDMCGRADRTDAIAPYNYANIRLAQGAREEAALAYQRALVRDPRFIEARYNLAQALEAGGKTGAAEAELARVLAADPTYADALFNLAQLKMKAGDVAEAKTLYERYLALGPPDDWAVTARKAIAYCAACLSA